MAGLTACGEHHALPFGRMCNLYRMTATVDEMRRVFGSFDGDRDNLPAFGEIYPNYQGSSAAQE